MHTMKRTQTAILALAVGAAILTLATPERDRNNAFRLRCELQTAGPQSLETLIWQQGTTPRLSLDQFRGGRAVNADSNSVAVVRFGPTATNTYFVSVTNYAVTGNGYLVQMPTIATNTVTGSDWWYTAYLAEGNALHWTGNGRLRIVRTTSTGADGLTWQEISSFCSVSQAEMNASIAAAASAGTNYTDSAVGAATNAPGTVRAVLVGDVWQLRVTTGE
jgi:hypothetical protein